MIIAINALAPIIFLIMVGAFLRRINFFDPGLWPALEKLSYYVLMPILLIFVISSKSMGNMPWQEIAIAATIPVLIATLIICLGRFIAPQISAQRFTSLFQGCVRFNTFVGLALANGLYGNSGLIVGAVASGFMIVLINFLCVSMFSVVLRTEGNIFKTVGLQVIKNPLIIGCLIGGLLNMTGGTLPASLSGSLEVLGRASLPIALMTVGAALRFSSLLKNPKISLSIGFIQFVIKPASAAICCHFLGLQGFTAATIILFLATPTAPSSYILSRQLGGDHEIMASIITQQTLFAFLTLPLTLWVINQYIWNAV